MEWSSSWGALVAARPAAGAAAPAMDNGWYGAYERRTVATKQPMYDASRISTPKLMDVSGI